MKIKVTRYGQVHFYAQCKDCDWDAGIDYQAKNRNQKVRNQIYKHIKETGHSVGLESGNSTDYSLDSI